MVVNSISFLLFFIVVFAVYYLPIVKQNERRQNVWLLLASYFFYGYADLRMIPLLLGATLVFYLVGLWLKNAMEAGKWKAASRITTFGVCLGVGLLLYFKYLGFFAESFASLLNIIGFDASWSTLNIVLPIGVSFFTFKLISYVVEIHRERIEPSRDFVEFALYVAFFPTILSGPIDRPNKFLPQLRKNHSFDYGMAVDGCRQILWGMFTKMCIADNLAAITDNVWSSIGGYESSTLLLVCLLYPLQMYADFDGYSNMAIGVGKILGIKITRNFNHPFLARNTAEYWRRWHMSLTSWITDYIFMPINIHFRDKGNFGVIIAVMVNLVVIGFWHGANWTYGLFGFYHGLLFIPLVFSGAFTQKDKIKENKYHLPYAKDYAKMMATYLLVAFGLIIFRAPSVCIVMEYVSEMCQLSALNIIEGLASLKAMEMKSYVFVFIFVMIFSEWLCRKKEYALQISSDSALGRHVFLRNCLYVVLALLILMCKGIDVQFIYFQF